ncbi:MAG: response regulator transcription factor [Nitriliruptorales bacterium]|nr:response regulator transcription factor [Nitriliruptorales bacterium]
MRRATVFLVDDHDVVLEGVRQVLEMSERFAVVGAAATAYEALAGILDTEPDLAIVDVRLARGDGIELIREVRSRQPSIECLVLTSFTDETAFYQALVAGACGFVTKDQSSDELLQSCLDVIEGRTLMTPDTVDALRTRANRLPDDERFLADLTPQECRILTYITEGRTNREIAEVMFLAEKTVRNYVSNLLGKMGMKNRTEAAAYVARSAARHHERELVLALSR